MPDLFSYFVFFLAVLPFLTLFVLVLGFHFRLLHASFYSFVLMLFVTLFFWQTPYMAVISALIKSFFATFEIVFIIFGALTLNYVLEHTKLMKVIKLTIYKSSKKPILSMLVIAWFFVSFIEGIAGFGLPAVLAAPLLINLGLRPHTSIILALLGDSVAVSFGAVGVPINKGILLTVPSDQLSNSLGITLSEIANQIALKNGLYHLTVSSFVPLLMTVLILKDLKKPLAQIKKYLIPSLVAGFSMTLFMYLTILLIDETLASIFGPLAGMLVFLFFYERDFLISLIKNKVPHLPNKEVFQAFLPYGLLVLLLLFLKLPIDFVSKIKALSFFNLKNLGSFSLDVTFKPLLSPGFSFILVTLFLYFYLKKLFSIKKVFADSYLKVRSSFVTLFLVISLVQLMLFSRYGNPFFAQNLSILEVTSNGLLGIADYLAQHTFFGDVLYYFIPGLFGVLGASLAGSATVSNILFSNISLKALPDPLQALALQNIGASLGNLTSLYNIFIVSSIVGLIGEEFKILKKTLPLVILFYLLSVAFSLFGVY